LDYETPACFQVEFKRNWKEEDIAKWYKDGVYTLNSLRICSIFWLSLHARAVHDIQNSHQNDDSLPSLKRRQKARRREWERKLDSLEIMLTVGQLGRESFKCSGLHLGSKSVFCHLLTETSCLASLTSHLLI
jgi:hypothetical protein